MKNKQMLLPLAAAMALVMALPAGAQPANPGNMAPPPAPAPSPVWLGVAVGPVPEAVQAQLPEGIEKNQGLMIMQVMPGSPAAEAGLQRNDVLISYNGDKLFSPQDLVQRVRAAKPGDKATLELVRHGKPVKVEVTLQGRWSRQPQNVPMAPQPGNLPPAPGAPKAEPRVWESFQSLSVVKNPDGKYKAVVEFLDPNGNKKRFEYEGTREEISDQVRKEPELPAAMKQQLLDALSDNLPAFPPMDMPAFPRMPDFPSFNDDFFSPPPWFQQRSPGGDYRRW